MHQDALVVRGLGERVASGGHLLVGQPRPQVLAVDDLGRSKIVRLGHHQRACERAEDPLNGAAPSVLAGAHLKQFSDERQGGFVHLQPFGQQGSHLQQPAVKVRAVPAQRLKFLGDLLGEVGRLAAPGMGLPLGCLQPLGHLGQPGLQFGNPVGERSNLARTGRQHQALRSRGPRQLRHLSLAPGQIGLVALTQGAQGLQLGAARAVVGALGLHRGTVGGGLRGLGGAHLVGQPVDAELGRRPFRPRMSQLVAVDPRAEVLVQGANLGQLPTQPGQLLVVGAQRPQRVDLAAGVDDGAVRGGQLGELLHRLVGQLEGLRFVEHELAEQ